MSQKKYSFLAKMKDITGIGPGILKELNALKKHQIVLTDTKL
jgi:hypothetical protein